MGTDIAYSLGGLPTLEECIKEASELWRSFPNVVTRLLPPAWGVLFEAYIEQIESFDNPEKRGRWKIGCAGTGVGKSLSWKIFVALLSRMDPEQHPGALIVVRRIEDAEASATFINERVKKMGCWKGPGPYALAWHTGNADFPSSRQQHPIDTLQHEEIPCLIISHRSMEIGLDPLGRTGRSSMMSDAVNSLGGASPLGESRKRKMILVDESFNLLQVGKIARGDLKKLMGCVPFMVEERFPVIVDLIHRTMAQAGNKVYPALLNPDDPMPDFKAFNEALKPCRLVEQGPKGSRADRDKHTWAAGIIDALDMFTVNWIWYHQNFHRPEDGHIITTASSRVHPDSPTVIVLDATAKQNEVYGLLPEGLVEWLPIIPNVRVYGTCTAHFAHGFNCGATTMKLPSVAPGVAREFIDNLQASLLVEGQGDSPRRKVVIVTHKDAEWAFRPILPKGWALDHLHGVEGSNKYVKHDVIALCGLPYMNPQHAALQYMGHKGPVEDPEKLPDVEGADEEDSEKDWRMKLEAGQMRVDILQTVNRAACRRVTGENENGSGVCPKTDIFMILPEEEMADVVTEALLDGMPGLQYDGWEYKTGTPKKEKAPTAAEKMIQELMKLQPGETLTDSELRRKAGVKPDARKRFIAKVKAGKFSGTLDGEVDFAPGGSGRGNASTFTRTKVERDIAHIVQ